MLSPLRVILVVCVLSALMVMYQWPVTETEPRPALSEEPASVTVESAELPAPVENIVQEPGLVEVKPDPAWVVLSPREVKNVDLQFAREDVPGRTLVKLNRALLEGVRQGQNLPIYIPQMGRDVEVQIHSVTTLKTGNRSITGKVDDHPLLDFTMTISDRATLVTIGTFEGVFNLRGDAEHAWIARGRDYNHKVDPSIPDYILPKHLRTANDEPS